MKEERKYIVIIHHRFHWLFAVIGNTRKKVSTYDSGLQISGSHKKPNDILKTSLESMTEEKWQIEQILEYKYPNKMKGIEGCGCRMLSYLSKVVKGQVIQHEHSKDRNRLYCYLQIVQTLKDNQIKRKQRRKRKVRGKEGEERKEEEIQQQQHKKKQTRKGEEKTDKGKMEIANQEGSSKTNTENRKRKSEE